jgi:acetyltransferase
MYAFPEMASRALAALWQYTRWRNHPPDEPLSKLEVNVKEVRRVLSKANAICNLGEASTRPVLTAYHIPVIPGNVAQNPTEAVEIANEIGYPVALKIVSPDILHKSEAGGILLNLENAAAVTAAFAQLMHNVKTAHPTARLEGVLVEAVAPPGYEVIVGMRRDPQFGPLMMFGLGGIYVELLTDVSFRVAPVSREEAVAMILETKAGRLLAGQRGHQAADINAVADCILRLSQLALDFPQIQEVEVNPLLVLAQGQGTVALDSRVILSTN